MYVPRLHRVEDESEALRYIRDNGFGTLISRGKSGLLATHMPFHLHERKGRRFLSCHIARANHQKHDLQSGERVLAIFMDTHGYVSSSWYDHVNVPTWNYIAVHVYGTVKPIEGEELISALKDLVDQYESSRPGRFYMEDMDDNMLQAHVNGLIGYKIEIERIEAAKKLSQNRHAKDYKNVVLQLEQEASDRSKEISRVMRADREDLFDE